jgi:XTP/dITP diphosphohydrolase
LPTTPVWRYALGGAPGIYSARYSGEDASDQQNLEKLLDALKDVPDDQRQAQFHCVLVYLRHAADPTPVVCHGSWPGVITRQAAGNGGSATTRFSLFRPRQDRGGTEP